MIDRYQTEDMQRIWSDVNKFKTWLKVEIAAVEVLNQEGLVPDESLAIIKSKANFDKDRVLEIEKTSDDFITNLTPTEKVDVKVDEAKDHVFDFYPKSSFEALDDLKITVHKSNAITQYPRFDISKKCPYGSIA